MSAVMPHRPRINPQNRQDRTLDEAQRQSRGGSQTKLGFIPYLRHPSMGIEMPIRVSIVYRGDGQPSLIDPNIFDDKSFWALPGGGVYVSHAPVEIL